MKPHLLPAGTGEKLQYLVHEHNDNTIRFVLRYPGLPDPAIMGRALQAVIGQVDVLHGSFYGDARSPYWLINEDYQQADYFCCLRTEGDPMAAARAAALQPVLPGGKTQLRCCLVQNSRESALAVNISHLCVDGGDGKYLLAKLAESYTSLCGGHAAAAVKNGSRAAEQAYEGMHFKELLSLCRPPDTGIRSGFPFADGLPGQPDMVCRQIPAGVMAAARKRAKACGATANDLLLAAMYRAYAALPAVDSNAPMSIMSMMDLRRHCSGGESEGLCNLSGALPTALPQGVQGDFAQTLAAVAAQTAKIKSDPLAGLAGLPLLHGAVRAMPMKLLLMAAGKAYGSFSLGLTNLGNIDCAALALGGLAPAEGLFGGPVKNKPGMQVSAASFNGACTLCIAGRYTQPDAAALRAFLARMADEVTVYAMGGA